MTETPPEEDIPDTDPEEQPVTEPDVTGDDPETVIDPSSDAVPADDDASAGEAP
ncbi:hypothetical protein [Aeromicrobium sp.]|uniref:hypothetical protein n=1 Tax=Aeromicrobium sp. TaxID=1871063 RepID=UPI003C403B23